MSKTIALKLKRYSIAWCIREIRTRTSLDMATSQDDALGAKCACACQPRLEQQEQHNKTGTAESATSSLVFTQEDIPSYPPEDCHLSYAQWKHFREALLDRPVERQTVSDTSLREAGYKSWKSKHSLFLLVQSRKLPSCVIYYILAFLFSPTQVH